MDSGKRYRRRSRLLLPWGAMILAVILLALGVDGALHARAEGWWFDSLGYGAIFWARFGFQVTLFTTIGTLSWLWLWGNLNLALGRLPRRIIKVPTPGLPEKWWARSPQIANDASNLPQNARDAKFQLNGALSFRETIAIAIVVIVAMELLGLHYGTVAWESFRGVLNGDTTTAPLGGLSLESIPDRFSPEFLGRRLGQIAGGSRWQGWLGGAIAAGAI
ncbi:MAG: UPF0182 family protein, partial [Cyanobacteria bacterium P01_F01_bin.153]